MNEHGQLPEIWAGVEATVNRVGDRYFDQCARTGHHTRPSDLELFAELGVRALRYPVLWENVALESARPADFRIVDTGLRRVRELGVRVIAGLVHHGSGPRGTSLLDPAFADGLARYACDVARRYPWIEDYTPVNEPLTTARFSALYGHWYPHRADDASFYRALVVQCRAVVQAMGAVRAVNPAARLVQTEDAGWTYSTPALSYQADFENERRWLPFDLLCGRVDQRHPLYATLTSSGIGARELGFFLDNPTPPDVVGLNYYVTSDRLLDERLSLYPASSHGGNGRERYADVEAARAWPQGITGHRAVLELAWRRFGIPVALTEVHLGCTREEQLRWLNEAWQGALAASAEVRAITVWSLLGAFDWNTLVTADGGCYEVGAFDVRGEAPRPTALARMTRALATDGSYEHPLLEQPGWWRRRTRINCGSFGEAMTTLPATRAGGSNLLIAGSSGTLGRAFGKICQSRAIPYRLLARAEMDIAVEASVEAAIQRHRPWAIVNAAGYVRVDDAERNEQRCFRENAQGPQVLATACARHGIQLVTFSSDLVFSGERTTPYRESDRPGPLNVYGRSKAQAETAVLQRLPSALIVRTGAFFGPWDRHNFVHLVLGSLSRQCRFTAANDSVVSPTYVPDLVHACLDLLIDGEGGIWHLTNDGVLSWADFARQAARYADMDPDLVDAAPTAALGMAAARPRFSALTSERARVLSSLDAALQRFLAERALEPG